MAGPARLERLNETERSLGCVLEALVPLSGIDLQTRPFQTANTACHICCISLIRNLCCCFQRFIDSHERKAIAVQFEACQSVLLAKVFCERHNHLHLPGAKRRCYITKSAQVLTRNLLKRHCPCAQDRIIKGAVGCDFAPANGAEVFPPLCYCAPLRVAVTLRLLSPPACLASTS